MTFRYISDPHFGHANIIEYCDRPFASVEEMDARLWEAFIEADRDSIVCCGDMSFKMQDVVSRYGPLPNRKRHRFVFGNHDRESHRKAYYDWFQMLFGRPKTWRTNILVLTDTIAGKPVKVLVSHLPQRDLQGCDFNVYGHVHNNVLRGFDTESGWVSAVSTHLCASVEMTDYRALTLEELVNQRKDK